MGINHQSNIGSWLLGLLHFILENPELPVFFFLFFLFLEEPYEFGSVKTGVVSCNSSILSFKNCWSCLSSLFWFRIKQPGPLIDSGKFRKLDSYLPGNKRLIFGIFATFCFTKFNIHHILEIWVCFRLNILLEPCTLLVIAWLSIQLHTRWTKWEFHYWWNGDDGRLGHCSWGYSNLAWIRAPDRGTALW